MLQRKANGVTKRIVPESEERAAPEVEIEVAAQHLLHRRHALAGGKRMLLHLEAVLGDNLASRQVEHTQRVANLLVTVQQVDFAAGNGRPPLRADSA